VFKNADGGRGFRRPRTFLNAFNFTVAYLRVYVGQLRRALEPEPSRPRWFLTEPGIGYRLAEPEDR
jgi:DNA-binding response OmpR family regulator